MTPSEMTLTWFMDDYGNIIRPYELEHNSYCARYYFYIGRF